MGVWVSGFFGSGKSHFLKVLSYLLRNGTHTHDGQTKQAVEFFESKIKDAMLFGDIKRAVAVAHRRHPLQHRQQGRPPQSGRDAILPVFLKVLNEMQGYCGDHPHIAHMERYSTSKGKLDDLPRRLPRGHRHANGSKERDAYQFHRDEVVKALAADARPEPGRRREVDRRGRRATSALTVENFCKWVKEYWTRKGPEHRLIFLVDEVGQFIGTDSHLMLNLQTITEDLGTICQGRAWVVVTSQEDIDAVLGEMKHVQGATTSRRFRAASRPALSLSSANVDEVIQSRLLAKRPDVKSRPRRRVPERRATSSRTSSPSRTAA